MRIEQLQAIDLTQVTHVCFNGEWLAAPGLRIDEDTQVLVLGYPETASRGAEVFLLDIEHVFGLKIANLVQSDLSGTAGTP